jgi:hypothetical protein
VGNCVPPVQNISSFIEAVKHFYLREKYKCVEVAPPVPRIFFIRLSVSRM